MHNTQKCIKEYYSKKFIIHDEDPHISKEITDINFTFHWQLSCMLEMIRLCCPASSMTRRIDVDSFSKMC